MASSNDLSVVPPSLIRSLSNQFPTLTIIPSWLSQSVISVKQAAGSRSLSDAELLSRVRQRLLASDMSAFSMSPTLPDNVPSHVDGWVGAGPRKAVMVQIVSILDIGVSAQSQLDVAEARKAAKTMLGGEAMLDPSGSAPGSTVNTTDLGDVEPPASLQGDDPMADFYAQEDEAGRPATVFSRKMLRMELSDGHNKVLAPAFEHKRIANLDMNSMQLGCKLLLRGAKIRHGHILLSPSCVTVLGGRVDDLADRFEDSLINKLRAKLGKGPIEPGKKSEPTSQPHSNLEDFVPDLDEDEEEALMEAEMAPPRPSLPKSSKSSGSKPTLENEVSCRFFPNAQGQATNQLEGHFQATNQTVSTLNSWKDEDLEFDHDDDILAQASESLLQGVEAQTSRVSSHRSDFDSAGFSRKARKSPRTIPSEDKTETEYIHRSEGTSSFDDGQEKEPIILFSDEEDDRPSRVKTQERNKRIRGKNWPKTNKDDPIVIESSPEP
ncbi:hypothetical protein IE53DRAFT_249926 [Violaceomyces palustris]|uniref:Uncharacterized protein n=1 Tax=Violaceomyces palustris TaxID=1673888 RepID=A0ACD0P3T9_9BASI|nr:hypothetical protein IE53DRAFT_249926 [Violaceomyces palustris]